MFSGKHKGEFQMLPVVWCKKSAKEVVVCIRCMFLVFSNEVSIENCIPLLSEHLLFIFITSFII